MTLSLQLRMPIGISAILVGLSSFAQQGNTKEGYAITWNKAIAVVADSISSGAHRLPAWTISVYETDANDVLDRWTTDMKAVSLGVSGKKPMKATGATIGGVGTGIVVMAQASTEKKAKLCRFTIAFAANDSTAMPDTTGQIAYVRGLAVKYNRAVVQGQIETYEKLIAKAKGKLSGAKDDVAKTRKSIAKSNAKLGKIKTGMAKEQGTVASYRGDVAGMEKKFALSNDPKDLQRLTKARTRLAKSESKLAKLMTQEADVEKDLAKHQERLKDDATTEAARSTTTDALQGTIDTLKRKQEAIK
ncbi:MAG: hypothetical protein IPP83_04380 [Flavobacteriales bacterium]|nr:hypothetical protein [Flavobacteriales bacterium]